MSEPVEPPRPSPPQLPAVPEPPGADDRLRRRREQLESDALTRLEAELKEVESYRMPLMEHLVELKNRLIWAVGAVVLGSVVGLIYADQVYGWLTRPFLDSTTGIEGVKATISLVDPLEGITVYIKLGLITGVVLASPVVSYHLWAFVAPGLYRSERRLVLPLSLASVALFLGGGAFCYYAIFPFAFPFFAQVLPVNVDVSADSYLSSVLWMMLAFGVTFQIPVVAGVLARVGLIDGQDMRSSFRYAIVVIAIVAAVITPPDPFTQIILMIPMTVLYGIAVIVAGFVTTKVREPEAPPSAET